MPARKPEVFMVNRVCGGRSPALDTNNPDEIRFSCQRQAGHGGAHKLTLEWDSDMGMFPPPPWRGETSSAGQEE